MMFSPSGIMKMKVKHALKGNWQTSLLVCFIASLPGIIAQVFTIVTGGDFATRLAAGMTQTLNGMTADAVPANIEKFLFDTMMAQFDNSFLVAMAVTVVMAIITPVLMLGLWKHLFSMLRGQGGDVKDVFSRMHYFFKAVGLQILTGLKILLWALPGVALLLAGSWISAEVLARMEGATVDMVMNTVSVLTYASYIAIFVPVIMAVFRYAMAPYHLADCPDDRLRNCIDESKTIMKHRKMSLFSLQLSFIGWHLVISMVYMFLQTTFGYVISQTVQMFLSLALSLYIEGTVCCFYLVAKNPEQIGFRRVTNPYVQQNGANAPEEQNHRDENEPLN